MGAKGKFLELTAKVYSEIIEFAAKNGRVAADKQYGTFIVDKAADHLSEHARLSKQKSLAQDYVNALTFGIGEKPLSTTTKALFRPGSQLKKGAVGQTVTKASVKRKPHPLSIPRKIRTMKANKKGSAEVLTEWWNGKTSKQQDQIRDRIETHVDSKGLISAKKKFGNLVFKKTGSGEDYKSVLGLDYPGISSKKTVFTDPPGVELDVKGIERSYPVSRHTEKITQKGFERGRGTGPPSAGEAALKQAGFLKTPDRPAGFKEAVDIDYVDMPTGSPLREHWTEGKFGGVSQIGRKELGEQEVRTMSERQRLNEAMKEYTEGGGEISRNPQQRGYTTESGEFIELDPNRPIFARAWDRPMRESHWGKKAREATDASPPSRQHELRAIQAALGTDVGPVKKSIGKVGQGPRRIFPGGETPIQARESMRRTPTEIPEDVRKVMEEAEEISRGQKQTGISDIEDFEVQQDLANQYVDAYGDTIEDLTEKLSRKHGGQVKSKKRKRKLSASRGVGKSLRGWGKVKKGKS